jgi:hypothetical protein
MSGWNVHTVLLSAIAFTPDDGPCETETFRAVVSHEIGLIKPEEHRKLHLCVYMYIYITF